jgi:hypothetical protein
MDINAVFERIMRLARLDTTVFDEVRDDERELVPAVVVAAVSFLLAGFGAWLWWEVIPDIPSAPDGQFVNNVILGTIFAIVLYGVAILIAYVVLAQAYRVQADLQAMVRTMGYAAIPMALCLLMVVPFVWPVFALVPLGLLLVMMIYAVQAASGAEGAQATIASTVGFAVMVLILSAIALSGDLSNVPMGVGQFGVMVDFN